MLTGWFFTYLVFQTLEPIELSNLLDMKYRLCDHEEQCLHAFQIGGQRTGHRWLFEASEYESSASGSWVNDPDADWNI